MTKSWRRIQKGSSFVLSQHPDDGSPRISTYRKRSRVFLFIPRPLTGSRPSDNTLTLLQLLGGTFQIETYLISWWHYSAAKEKNISIKTGIVVYQSHSPRWNPSFEKATRNSTRLRLSERFFYALFSSRSVDKSGWYKSPSLVGMPGGFLVS